MFQHHGERQFEYFSTMERDRQRDKGDVPQFQTTKSLQMGFRVGGAFMLINNDGVISVMSSMT